MYRSVTALFPKHKLGLFVAALIVIILVSCGKKNEFLNTALKKQFAVAENLSLLGKEDSAKALIKQLRKKLTTNNPVICDYYCYMVETSGNDPAKMNLYADSALAFFDNDSKKTDYPEEYFKSLLKKGDACMRDKQYITALNYYYRARRTLPANICDDGTLASKLGTIYYNQKNFTQAAKYWAESANRLYVCDNRHNALNLFYDKQGFLNNAGFSYEKAGMLDSAIHYYLKDLNFINKADSENGIRKRNIAVARAVIYDNLGGANLKLGKLQVAEKYLKLSLDVPDTIDGAHIPPLLKLSELYLRSAQMDKASNVFTQGKALLDRFGKDDPAMLMRWEKLYAEYLFKKNLPDEAFIYQERYIALKDSLDVPQSDLYRLDIERELNTLQQQNNLQDLEQKDKIKMTYLLGVGIVALLSVIIIFLINRNLNRTKNSHRDATLYNQQLQITLEELERINQNYIRIMRVMAHNLRNPLSGMTGLAALLLGEDEFTEDNKHMLRLIETTGTHSMEMINELLKSGLADENEQIVKQTLDIRSLLYDSVELLQFKAQDKDQQLLFESGNEPIMAEVNHEKIWRVFNNIIVNAIKFSHHSGIVKVSIVTVKGNILVSVADSGVGIPDKDKNNVFEMFTPAKKAGTNGEQPFGLGLSISKKIVEKHGGRIWFESTVDVGTTFYIELPGLA